ncbi:TonB family protein [Gemmatirosa kalamazoonensis]|uniref:TonB family protein n=1 Tax=Gemmatirosa kalamazoonensis TaxID=861299 RepID=W0RLF0_9BACT|nr:energy transducer TonB [Gemmatirosa kalamazoonensis]AHG91155.1 TonB family protein [Gemmatirosa kalamazoonensis]
MFNNLLESKAKKQRSTGGTIFSVILHTGIIAGAVYATAHATIEAEKPKEEKVEFVEMKKDEPPPPKNEPPPPPPPDVAVAPPPPKGFQVLTAPVEIPDVIPQVDLSKKVTDEADFSGKGVAGGVAKGAVGGTGPVVQDQPYFEFQVEKPVVPAPGNTGPRYPEMLKSANVEGTVLAQFVVDTSGHVEPGSFKVLKSDHDLFSQAVKSALANMRFLPAEVGGRKVKQLVQQPFQFQLTK